MTLGGHDIRDCGIRAGDIRALDRCTRSGKLVLGFDADPSNQKFSG